MRTCDVRCSCGVMMERPEQRSGAEAARRATAPAYLLQRSQFVVARWKRLQNGDVQRFSQ